MTTVRFATICDGCGERSSEYSSYPACLMCGQHTCPTCAEIDFHDKESGMVICKECYRQDLASNYARPPRFNFALLTLMLFSLAFWVLVGFVVARALEGQ